MMRGTRRRTADPMAVRRNRRLAFKHQPRVGARLLRDGAQRMRDQNIEGVVTMGIRARETSRSHPGRIPLIRI